MTSGSFQDWTTTTTNADFLFRRRAFPILQSSLARLCDFFCFPQKNNKLFYFQLWKKIIVCFELYFFILVLLKHLQNVI